jgi:hypothetical protein
MGAEVGAGGEVVVAVPGAVDGVGEVQAGVGVEEFEADGGGDGLGDEDGVVPAPAGQFGRQLGGEGGEVGGRSGHREDAAGMTGRIGMTRLSNWGGRVGDSYPGKEGLRCRPVGGRH